MQRVRIEVANFWPPGETRPRVFPGPRSRCPDPHEGRTRGRHSGTRGSRGAIDREHAHLGPGQAGCRRPKERPHLSGWSCRRVAMSPGVRAFTMVERAGLRGLGVLCRHDGVGPLGRQTAPRWKMRVTWPGPDRMGRENRPGSPRPRPPPALIFRFFGGNGHDRRSAGRAARSRFHRGIVPGREVRWGSSRTSGRGHPGPAPSAAGSGRAAGERGDVLRG